MEKVNIANEARETSGENRMKDFKISVKTLCQKLCNLSARSVIELDHKI